MGAVALVHDYLLVLRGAERVFATMTDCWPEAPIFTTLYSADGTDGRFARRDIHTSYLQRSRAAQSSFRRLLPLYPSAVERLDVRDHDVVVSSSSAFAHGVRPAEGAVHVCYCHSPFRYAWHERAACLSEVPRPLRPAVGRTLDRIRRWDIAASERVTHYIANSRCVRDRIAEFYGREAPVIHPPVDVERFSPAAADDHFLFVGEIVRHKRLDVALEAARRAGVRFKVIGRGPELERLEHEYADVPSSSDGSRMRRWRRLRPRACPRRAERRGIRDHRHRGAGSRAPGARRGPGRRPRDGYRRRDRGAR